MPNSPRAAGGGTKLALVWTKAAVARAAGKTVKLAPAIRLYRFGWARTVR